MAGGEKLFKSRDQALHLLERRLKAVESRLNTTIVSMNMIGDRLLKLDDTLFDVEKGMQERFHSTWMDIDALKAQVEELQRSLFPNFEKTVDELRRIVPPGNPKRSYEYDDRRVRPAMKKPKDKLK